MRKARLAIPFVALTSLTIAATALATNLRRDLMAHGAFAPWPNPGAQACIAEAFGGMVSGCGGATQIMVFNMPTESLNDLGNPVFGSQQVGFEPAGAFNGGFTCHVDIITNAGTLTTGPTVAVNYVPGAFNFTTVTVPFGGMVRLVCTGVHNGEGIRNVTYIRN